MLSATSITAPIDQPRAVCCSPTASGEPIAGAQRAGGRPRGDLPTRNGMRRFAVCAPPCGAIVPLICASFSKSFCGTRIDLRVTSHIRIRPRRAMGRGVPAWAEVAVNAGPTHGRRVCRRTLSAAWSGERARSAVAETASRYPTRRARCSSETHRTPRALRWPFPPRPGPRSSKPCRRIRPAGRPASKILAPGPRRGTGEVRIPRSDSHLI